MEQCFYSGSDFVPSCPVPNLWLRLFDYMRNVLYQMNVCLRQYAILQSYCRYAKAFI